MKAPSFQFYPGDWLRDPALRSVSSAARGLWMDMLCLMHESPRRGFLCFADGNAMQNSHLARSTGNTERILNRLLAELETCGVFSRENDIIYSRRMVRDQQLSEIRRAAGKQGGNPILVGKEVNQNDNQKPTPSSSSSSSSSKQLPPPPPARAPQTLAPGEPDPSQLVASAVASAAKVWPSAFRGDASYARMAWEREAASHVSGVADWCSRIVALAKAHAEAHLRCKEANSRHFIPTLERWVTGGDYALPPPNTIGTPAAVPAKKNQADRLREKYEREAGAKNAD